MWDPRAAFDTIVQSSTVELFNTCAVAVAPLARSTASAKAVHRDRLLGSIQFSSARMTGTITLSVPMAIFAGAKSEGVRRPSGTDWIRELSNQLLGRIKKRLTQFQVTLHSGLPWIPSPETLQRLAGSKTASVYEFRTLRGEIIVVVDGSVEYAALAYTGAVELASEGDIILF